MHTYTLICIVQSLKALNILSHLSPFQTINSSKLLVVQTTTIVPIVLHGRKLTFFYRSKISLHINMLAISKHLYEFFGTNASACTPLGSLLNFHFIKVSSNDFGGGSFDGFNFNLFVKNFFGNYYSKIVNNWSL
jgi:hypothetical protein